MTVTAVETQQEVLKIADRCDRCGAQAFVLAVSEDHGMDLMFCGHHYSRHEAALAGSGAWVITDERWRINARPSASSGTAADDE